MNEGYEPKSSFLTWVLSEEAPLVGGEHAEYNLSRVIALTEDEDTSNRDWATFILAVNDVDTPAIRRALLARADDADERVRAQAIEGLASKEPLLALPYIKRALEGSSALVGIFDAAVVVADPSLVGPLRKFAKKASADWSGDVVREALKACELAAKDV